MSSSLNWKKKKKDNDEFESLGLEYFPVSVLYLPIYEACLFYAVLFKLLDVREF